MTDDELRDLLEQTIRELRRLRTGELVARLSEAQIETIALRCADRLEERLLPRTRPEPVDAPPRRAKAKSSRFF